MVRRHDKVRFGKTSGVFHVEWVQETKGKYYLIVYGPTGTASAKGGRVFFAGPKPTTRISDIDGKRLRLKPWDVYLVSREGS